MLADDARSSVSAKTASGAHAAAPKNGNHEEDDWANAPALQVGVDLPTGQSDDAFGQGSKENTAVPTVDFTNGS